MQADFKNIKRHMEEALQILVKDYYKNDRELFHDLSGAITDIVVRLKNAADNNVLESIFSKDNYAIGVLELPFGKVFQVDSYCVTFQK
ncbi:hypothetical protein [Anaerotruncus colihominis]|mgnify:FL=1|uniref:hypothetical protein n=1 Tax=Anaerotruncus colihominis TaxID=169435 RepID=UPI00242DBEBB|nr:hypothetical protein [Anaerotruncus colihominis]